MTKRLSQSIALLVLLGGGIFNSEATALSKTVGAAGGIQARPDAVLIGTRGRVLLKRKNWSQFEPVTADIPLYRGDLLRVEGSSEATILCAGQRTLTKVPSGFSGVPCFNSQPAPTGIISTILQLIFGPSSSIGATRGSPPDDVPVIVSPRGSKILNPNPVLRWMAVAGASAATVYNVALVARGREVWSTEVNSDTQTVYPSDHAPRLVPGEIYRLVVRVKGCSRAEANGCSSDKETEPGRGFRLLTEDEAKAEREAESQIRALGLSEDQTAFLTAKFQIARGLYAEGVERLEQLSKTMPVPPLEQSLGDSYMATGLIRLAEKHYLRASELAQSAGDKEGQAEAERALGDTYNEIGNKGEAVMHMQKAVALRRSLGDTARAAEIQQQIETLQKPQKRGER